MIQDWVKEKSNFVPGNFPEVARDGNWMNVAHYTQIIWPTTTDVGCGMAPGGGFNWFVCRYSPGGNKDGKPVGLAWNGGNVTVSVTPVFFTAGRSAVTTTVNVTVPSSSSSLTGPQPTFPEAEKRIGTASSRPDAVPPANVVSTLVEDFIRESRAKYPLSGSFAAEDKSFWASLGDYGIDALMPKTSPYVFHWMPPSDPGAFDEQIFSIARQLDYGIAGPKPPEGAARLHRDAANRTVRHLAREGRSGPAGKSPVNSNLAFTAGLTRNRGLR